MIELKNPRGGIKRFRPAKASDIREMPQQSRQYVEDGDTYRMVTITSVKTWKTRRDVMVKWKYGIYTYGTSMYDDTGLVNGIRFLIEC